MAAWMLPADLINVEVINVQWRFFRSLIL